MITTTGGTVLILALVLGVLALAGLTAWALIRLGRLERHYRLLTADTQGGTLQAVLEEHVRQVREATGRVRELDEQVQRLEVASRSHLQRLGFLRFNPFRDTGGDQSFVIVLADQEGNGVAVSSLHSRDVTRVYAKPLKGWQSPYPLTDEEQQAVQQAQGEAPAGS